MTLGLAVLSLWPTLSLAAPQTTRIAVLEVVVEGGADPVIGNQMTGRLAQVIGERPNVTVIAPDDIRALLEKETQNQLLGCEEESCLSEIGGALGADILIKGRVSKIDKGYGVSFSAVESGTARPLAHSSDTWGGPSIGLLGLVEPIVERLLGGKKGVTGSLQLSGAVSGSQIFVDGQIRGTVPAGQIGALAPGAHKLELAEPGHRPFVRWITIRGERAQTVAVQQQALDSAPFYATWWFWTAVGVGVAAAATGATLGLRSGSGEPVDPPTSGVNIAVNADRAFTGGR